MLKGISWTDFVTWMSILTAVYYVLMFILFKPARKPTVAAGVINTNEQPQGIKRVWRVDEASADLQQPAVIHLPDTVDDLDSGAPGEQNAEPGLAQLDEFMTSLKSVIENLPDHTDKPQFLEQVGLIAGRLPLLQGSAYKEMAEDQVLRMAYEKFRFMITADEVAAIWNGTNDTI